MYNGIEKRIYSPGDLLTTSRKSLKLHNEATQRVDKNYGNSVKCYLWSLLLKKRVDKNYGNSVVL